MATNTDVVVVDGGLPSKYVWQMELIAGVITLGLGIVLALKPSQSLNVVCVFIGILLVVGGIFHFIRALDHEEQHRAWIAVAGLLELVIGVVMIRHLNLTKSVIGLLIGIVWIVQGIVALLSGIMGGVKGTRWLGHRLRPHQPGRRHRRGVGAAELGQRPGRAPRDLVHRDGPLRAGRRIRPAVRPEALRLLRAPSGPRVDRSPVHGAARGQSVATRR